MKIMDILVPLETLNEESTSEHWAVKSIRHWEKKILVQSALKENDVPKQLPCHIFITRIAPRNLDYHENLMINLKWCVDAISEYFLPGKSKARAVDDKRFTFTHCQRIGESKEYAIALKCCYYHERDTDL